MINLDNEIKITLTNNKEIQKYIGKNIFKTNSPGTENAYNSIFYQEISNVPALRGDDREIASRVTYQIFVYTQKNLLELVNAVEKAMIEIAFSRFSSENIDNLPVGVSGKKMLFITTREN